MQPYFLPYAGYFRLIAGVDLFVVYDCVQFPRRGWVHRNKLNDHASREQWLTLPLVPAPQSARIADLRFPADAPERMAERLRPFPAATRPRPELAELIARLIRPCGTPVDYLEALARECCALMGLKWEAVRSSGLKLGPDLRGQARVIEIARRCGATRYLNAPGGRDLYDSAAFAEAGMVLDFLPPYPGPGGSILQRLHDDGSAALGEDMEASGHG